MTRGIEAKIVDDLMKEIIGGRYKASDKLPSENDLANLYKVPRITARNAYTRLKEMGYIYSKQGKGIFLKDRRKKIQLSLTGNESFSKKMKDKGYHFISKNIYCERIQYEVKIFSNLGASTEEEVYKIGRLRILDKQPAALHISYVRKSIFPHIEHEGKEIKSMFDYYQASGYDGFYSDESVMSISFPTMEERDIFKCAALTPLLIIESNCIHKKTETVLEISKIIYRSDYFQYIMN